MWVSSNLETSLQNYYFLYTCTCTGKINLFLIRIQHISLFLLRTYVVAQLKIYLVMVDTTVLQRTNTERSRANPNHTQYIVIRYCSLPFLLS